MYAREEKAQRHIRWLSKDSEDLLFRNKSQDENNVISERSDEP